MQPDLKTLMRHKPPMLLVDALTETGADYAVSVFKVRPDNIFLDSSGLLAREALAEIMAQTLAAFNAAKNAAGGARHKGFLVGLKNIIYHGDAAAGDDLTCRVRIVDFLSQTYIAQCAVYKDGQKLCEGEIRIFVFDPPAVIASVTK